MKIKFKNAIVGLALGLFAGGAHAESSFRCDRLEVTAEKMVLQKIQIKHAGDFMSVVEDQAKAKDNYQRKVYIGLGVFMVVSERNNRLTSAHYKISDLCEEIGYEKTEEMLYDFGNEYLENIGE